MILKENWHLREEDRVVEADYLITSDPLKILVGFWKEGFSYLHI